MAPSGIEPATSTNCATASPLDFRNYFYTEWWKNHLALGFYYFQCVRWLKGRDSSVGKATGYGLDGPGIESQGARFSAPVQTGPRAHPAFYTMGTGSFLGVKRPRRGVYHPPPSSAEVQERVEQYLYSTSGPTWPVIGWILPLLYLHLCQVTSAPHY